MLLFAVATTVAAVAAAVSAVAAAVTAAVVAVAAPLLLLRRRRFPAHIVKLGAAGTGSREEALAVTAAAAAEVAVGNRRELLGARERDEERTHQDQKEQEPVVMGAVDRLHAPPLSISERCRRWKWT